MGTNGKQGRVKVPLLAPFIMCGYSKRHEIPFHVVGMHEGRHYDVALRRDQLDDLLEKLTQARDEYDATQAQTTEQLSQD